MGDAVLQAVEFPTTAFAPTAHPVDLGLCSLASDEIMRHIHTAGATNTARPMATPRDTFNPWIAKVMPLFALAERSAIRANSVHGLFAFADGFDADSEPKPAASIITPMMLLALT